MGFSNAVKIGLNKFLSPYGRSSVSEFWWYALFIYVISGVLGWFGGRLQSHGMEQVWLGVIFEVLSALLVASVVCASIRRLHDTGKSGWNALWYFLPIIGWIIEIVLLCGSSQPYDNKYGPQPK